jgi:hypothetical protein
MDSTISVDKAMTATTATSPVKKVVAHWARKVIYRRLQEMGILDTGATSGAAPKKDEDAFEDTGKLLKKMFMFPDKCTNKAMKPKAKALSSCKRDEHSARTTLDTSQHTKISRCRVHKRTGRREK